MYKSPVTTFIVTYALILVGGCTSYATPGRGADLANFGVAASRLADDQRVQQALDKRPLVSFPTGIAVARVQAPGYHSETAQGWGSGNYSIVTTRDIEEPVQVEKLAKLPQINGIAAINRLLLPHELKSDAELRQAAAQLHADILLVYTIDTVFATNDLVEPLTLVTLGLAPNQRLRVISTTSAALLDTRNGYVYGVCEATENRRAISMAWGSTSAMDELRRKTESAAFERLIGELEKTWVGVVRQHARAEGPRAGGVMRKTTSGNVLNFIRFCRSQNLCMTLFADVWMPPKFIAQCEALAKSFAIF